MKFKETSSINSTLANFDQLPDNAYIRPKQCAQLLGISIATFWRLASKGRLVTHRLTERTTTVKVKDIRAFMAGK